MLLVNRLEEMQERLGDLNDVFADRDLCRDIATSVSAGETMSLGFEAGVAAGRDESNIEALIKEAQAAQRRFRNARPFWG